MHQSHQEHQAIIQIKRMTVDHTRVPPEQREIHETLLNWARWVKPRHAREVHPMFRQYRHGYEESSPRADCDLIKAQQIEKLIGTMPKDHALVLRWWYVFTIEPYKVCRHMGLTNAGLAQMVIDARFMVRNRLQFRN